ncbi:MAG: cupin domain-containing protein [Dictyoglomaceae bacterium]|nr:cupin domain-containing protein [Dictyoglomaceae bacterium]
MERVNEKDREFRFGDWGPKYLMRGPKLEWGIVKIIPGKELGAHYHKEVEEIFYVLSGRAEMIVDNKNFEINIGDAIRVEPNEEHNIVNPSDDFLAVFIKVPYLPEDKYSKS